MGWGAPRPCAGASVASAPGGIVPKTRTQLGKQALHHRFHMPVALEHVEELEALRSESVAELSWTTIRPESVPDPHPWVLLSCVAKLYPFIYREHVQNLFVLSRSSSKYVVKSSRCFFIIMGGLADGLATLAQGNVRGFLIYLSCEPRSRQSSSSNPHAFTPIRGDGWQYA